MESLASDELTIVSIHAPVMDANPDEFSAPDGYYVSIHAPVMDAKCLSPYA